MSRAVLVAVAAAGCVACSDPLVEPEEIVDLRVLGATAEVTTDPPRATPRPGETVRVRVLVAGPDGPAAASFGIIACRAANTTTGLPICREELARTSVTAPTVDVPSIELALPSDFGAERVSFVGVACAGGSPRLSTAAAELGCSAEAMRAAPFFFDVAVATEAAQDNANPSVSADALTIGGATWEETTGDPCDAAPDEGRDIAAGSRSAIHMDVGGAAEPLGGSGREILTIAHYVTDGDLERHFSVVEDGDEPEVEVSWKAPRSAPAGGAPAHFYAVIRDGRGGASWVHRAACVRE